LRGLGGLDGVDADPETDHMLRALDARLLELAGNRGLEVVGVLRRRGVGHAVLVPQKHGLDEGIAVRLRLLEGEGVLELELGEEEVVELTIDLLEKSVSVDAPCVEVCHGSRDSLAAGRGAIGWRSARSASGLGVVGPSGSFPRRTEVSVGYRPSHRAAAGW